MAPSSVRAEDADATWAYRRLEEGSRWLTTWFRICLEDLGLRRVIGNCFTANEPPWRPMGRLGMGRGVHTVRAPLHRDLGWQDGYNYAMLAEEWRKPFPG